MYREFFREASTQDQIAFRSDEVNCNVHKMLALTMNQNTEITRKSLNPFKPG